MAKVEFPARRSNKTCLKKLNTIFLIIIITHWHSFKNQKFLLQSLNILMVFDEMDLFMEVWAFIQGNAVKLFFFILAAKTLKSGAKTGFAE